MNQIFCYELVIDYKPHANPDECKLLYNCKDSCGYKAIYLAHNIGKGNIKFSKLNLLKTLVFSEKMLFLMRHPGALPENDLLKTSVSCGACMKVWPQILYFKKIF